jgi:hypothetical protein
VTSDPRTTAYPLEALRKREGWRLETLQAELAAASRRAAESIESRDELRRAHRTLSNSASPARAAIIDPAATARRLAYLSDLQGRAVEAAQRVLALERARELLRARSLEQQVRFEAIEAHRRNHLREEAVVEGRKQGAEADREWLARSNWRRLRSKTVERVDGELADPSGESV